MGLFHKGIRPCRDCSYFFALRPGHRTNHDPADTGEIHFAQIFKQWLKPDRKYLEELLTVLNLKERRNHLPSQLSGGQQQRVAIGRALITRPSLILADEPTGNLDTQNSSEVIALLKEASRKYEQTIIMITHNRSIAQSADRILQVSDGVLTDLGRCRE